MGDVWGRRANGGQDHGIWQVIARSLGRWAKWVRLSGEQQEDIEDQGHSEHDAEDYYRGPIDGSGVPAVEILAALVFDVVPRGQFLERLDLRPSNTFAGSQT